MGGYKHLSYRFGTRYQTFVLYEDCNNNANGRGTALFFSVCDLTEVNIKAYGNVPLYWIDAMRARLLLHRAVAIRRRCLILLKEKTLAPRRSSACRAVWSPKPRGPAERRQCRCLSAPPSGQTCPPGPIRRP